MAKVQQQITFFWQRDGVKKLFSSAKVAGAVDAMGKRSVELMRERTMAGLDRNGKPFAPYTKYYAKRKRQLLGGGGAFAAQQVNDHIRLSGDLFRAMRYSVNQAAQFKVGSIDGSYRMYIAGSAAKKAEGLMSTRGRNQYSSYSKSARLFFGVAEGNSSQARKEKAELKKVFVKKMGFKPSAVAEVGL